MKGKVALVTGGSRGIGKAVCEVLRARGAEVLSPSRQELDLLSPSSIAAYFDALAKPVDILVNNAGINNIQECLDISGDNLSDSLQVNLLAPLLIAKKLIPGMKRNNYGRIVNISSVWSVVTKPGRLVYSMTKSGLNAVTRSLAVELAEDNILVNSVAPGYVNTELTKKNNTPVEIDKIRETIPAKRLAEPSEIAEIVAFLSSSTNSYITGQIIIADGGYTCR
jgi:3-oxoacyl-[acyl-carrier protein] reductase